ncbi:hypothetical protein EJ110_NYTH41176 [Nymphaea thermarum]|nr:hypothetical protein EJ110_NYTH41176 [Nymphaea thermarum]
MDEAEFRRLLDLFPVVRSRSYCADDEASKASTSREAREEVAQWQEAWGEAERKEDLEIDINDPFWGKLRLAAERKVSSEEAERFCNAFQMVHKKFVYEALSSDAANRILHSSGKSTR